MSAAAVRAALAYAEAEGMPLPFAATPSNQHPPFHSLVSQR